MYSLEVTTWVHEMSRHLGTVAVRGVNLDIFLLYTLRLRMPTRTALPVNKKDRGYRWLWVRFLGGKAPHIDDKWITLNQCQPRRATNGF